MIHKLPISSVRPNPDQPRKHFDERALAELAASLLEHGQLQPIKVRPAGDGFLIVCGERRWRAAQLAQLPTIDATVTDLSDEDLADQAIVENLQRADITPLEEARAYQARIDAGYTVAKLAKRLGIRQPHRITDRLSLLRLTPEHQVALEKGVLSPGQATEMSRLDANGQRVIWRALASGRLQQHAELKRTVQAMLEAEAQVDMFSPSIEPTPEEKAIALRLEDRIAKAADALGRGFDGNEIVIARRVDPLRVDVIADKLELIEQAAKKLRLALRAAAVTRAA